VRFDVPSGWRIASGLDDTADETVFTAPDYDTFVEQPTLMGQLDVTRFMVDGKPHHFVSNPAGAFSAEKTRTLIGHLTKLAETQGSIFGGLRYRKFVYFCSFRPSEASATVLEHQNSYVTASRSSNCQTSVGALGGERRDSPSTGAPQGFARRMECVEGFTRIRRSARSPRDRFCNVHQIRKARRTVRADEPVAATGG